MSTIKKQYYGIKFPLTANNINGFFLDLNENLQEKIASEVAHVILTPKRTRLHCPEFGTDLLKFIFEENDETTWDKVLEEAKECVRKFVSNTELIDIQIVSKDNSIFLDMNYTVKKGMVIENNRSVIKL